MKKIIVFISCIILTYTIKAQTKIAYVDTKELLMTMPEIKGIDSVYSAYENILSEELKKMKINFQEKNASFIKDSATLPPAIKELKRKELSDDIIKYRNFQEQAETELVKEKEKLLQPLIEKIKSTIELIAKEKKYALVFDKNNLPIVYGNSTLDITLLVKQKLNNKQ